MRTSLCIALTVLMTALMAACGESSEFEGAWVGRYVLITANGQSMPATILTHDDVWVKIYAGELRLRKDGTCAGQTVFGPPDGSNPTTRNTTGTYNYVGNRFTMNWDGAGMTVGMLKDDTLTVDNAGDTLVYLRD